MLATLTVILVLLVALTAAVALFSVVFRLWLDYRVRMAVLRKLEVGPQAVRTPADIDGIMASLDPAAGQRSEARGDRLYTGLFVVLFGALSVVVGRSLRVGPVAVGLDMGGWTLVALGVALSLFGLVTHWLYRSRTAQ